MIPKSWSKEYKKEVLDELLNDYTLQISKEFEKEIGCDIVSFSELKKEVEEEENNPEKYRGILTGYPRLNNTLNGIRNGELIVLSGASGTGKTLFAQCLTIKMLMDCKKILFFSYEMPPKDIYKRYRIMFSHDTYTVPPDFQDNLPIYFPVTAPHTTEGLIAFIEKMKEEKEIEFVIIDHLHFFLRSNQNTSQEIGVITRELKNTAIRLNIPILLLCHIRKLNHNGIPKLDDLKDSSSIAQDADTVIVTWRSNDPKESENNRYMKIRILKNRREGRLNTIDYKQSDYLYLEEQMYNKEIKGLEY